MFDWGLLLQFLQIFFIDMYFVVFKGGVLFLILVELVKDFVSVKGFVIDVCLVKVYNDWLVGNGIKVGSICEFIQVYICQYFWWCGLLYEGKGGLLLNKCFYWDVVIFDKKDLLEVDVEFGKMICDWCECGNLDLDQCMGQMVWKYVCCVLLLVGVLMDVVKECLIVEEKKFYDIMCVGLVLLVVLVMFFDDYIYDFCVGFWVVGKYELVFIIGGYVCFCQVFLQGEGDLVMCKIGELVECKVGECVVDMVEDVCDIKDYIVCIYDCVCDCIVSGYYVVEDVVVCVKCEVEDKVLVVKWEIQEQVEVVRKKLQVVVEVVRDQVSVLKKKIMVEIKCEVDEVQCIYDVVQCYVMKKYEELGVMWYSIMD